jgi:hypothetical protein
VVRHQTVLVILAGVLTSAAACASSSNPGPARSSVGTPDAASATSPASRGAFAAGAPAAVVAGRFVLLQGSDTIGVERFDRTADRLRAEFTARGTVAFRYDAALAPDASVSRIRLTVMPPAGGELTSTAAFAGDSVTLTREAPSSDAAKSARRGAARGSVPFINPSPSLMEQIVRRARAIGGGGPTATAAVPVFVGGGGPPNVAATVTFAAPDSARLDLGGVEVLLRVDGSGAILGGSVPTQRLTIERVE